MTASDIQQRVDELTFNASLVAELRVIEFVRRLVLSGNLQRKGHKHVLLHHINGGQALDRMGASRSRADTAQVQALFLLGRRVGARWLEQHIDDIGVRDSLEAC